jgi:Ca2+-transporting ATPase
MNIHQLTLFFTFFVLLQFWNLLNAKTYGSSDSAFHHLKKDKGVLLVLGLILAGQWLIVEWGGNMFRTEPLSWCEWGLLLALSSIVLWVGEVVRLVMRWKERSR